MLVLVAASVGSWPYRPTGESGVKSRKYCSTDELKVAHIVRERSCTDNIASRTPCVGLQLRAMHLDAQRQCCLPGESVTCVGRSCLSSR